MNNILIIDDDAKLRDLLREYLAGFDFSVIEAANADEAFSCLATQEVDLVILDIMLPGRDGFDICRQIRATSTLPLIMLTARGDTTDRIVGLELGADDYLSKPFNPRELVARIKAVLRRKGSQENVDSVDNPANQIRRGPFILDSDRRKVTKAGHDIQMTTVEFELMRIFLSNEGIVLSRDRLLELSRDRDYLPFDRSIDVHVSRLRSKIEDNVKQPQFIKTVWGVGYVFSSR